MRLHDPSLALAAIVFAPGALAIAVAPAAAQMPVVDATNYAQNLLQAARALEQINNQVKSLQNETSMIEGMTKNLKTIPFPQLERLTQAMGEIDRLMGEAGGIQFKVAGLDRQIASLFPGARGAAPDQDQRIAEARARLDAVTAAYRHSLTVQAQIAENVRADAGTLSELATISQGAAGSLQAQQAANQLLALGVKQQLQLQNLMASQYRDDAIERARRAQAEEDGRAATRRFLDGGGRKN